MWSNFHTHSHYCDGKGSPAEIAAHARHAGLSCLGFSSHAPVPIPVSWCMKDSDLPVYLRDTGSLEQGDGLEIFRGLEIDFIPGVVAPTDYKNMLDYTIGSIHFVDSFDGIHWEIDGSRARFLEGLDKIFRNDIRAAVTRYFSLTRQMVDTATPDIVGHLDKIKIQNRPEPLFEETEDWYIGEVEKTLSVISARKAIVEVNTRGVYQKKTPETYPGTWILERMHAADIPITLNSDAHHKDDLISEFRTTAAILSDIGFRKMSVLRGGHWKQVPFNRDGLDL